MSNSEYYKNYYEDGISLVALPYKEYWDMHSYIYKLENLIKDMLAEKACYMIRNNLGNPEFEHHAEQAHLILGEKYESSTML